MSREQLNAMIARGDVETPLEFLRVVPISEVDVSRQQSANEVGGL